MAASCLAVLPARAAPSIDPEREVLRIARTLKPIPDDEWKRIAGDRIAQKYQITQGDTLYDISKRLFGDSKYWPKIWALNNGRILNPHLIFPGNTINFLPGTGTSLPGVSVETAENDQTAEPGMTDAGEPGHPPRAQEWKMLPPQEWENVELQVPPEVDPLGFDTRSRVTKPTAVGFDLPLMAASQKIEKLGLIFADEKGSDFISLDDLVFIHSQGELQVGQTYSIIDDPQMLQNEATPRIGWAYPLVGKVKILQQRDGVLVGIVTAANHPFTRGANLAPLQPHVNPMDPIPGPSAMSGVVLLDEQYSTSTIAQHAYVFIDRGSDDGVTPGMIFRNYQHDDPNNDKHITSANVVINADIMVIQTSPKFSTGFVLSSETYFTEGAPVVLLTDVSDLIARPDPARIRLERAGVNSPDELDSLDQGKGLSESEKRELRQLEKWKENQPPAPVPPVAVPPPEAPPTPEAPPPEAPPTPEAPPPPAPEAPNPAPTAPAPPPPAATTPPPAATTAPAPSEEEEIPPPPSDEPVIAAPPSQPATTSPEVPPTAPEPDIPPPPPPAPDSVSQ